MADQHSRSRGVAARLTAEFFVVFLGVFVALAADAWWEAHTERVDERAYYAALIRDLEADTLEYAFSIEFMERSIEASEHVAAAIRGEWSDYPRERPLVQSLILAAWRNFPDWSTGTIDELINSGSIRLIQNDAVKTALFARHNEAEEFRPRAQGPEHSTYVEYNRLIRGLAPLEAFQGVYRTDLDDVIESDFGVPDAELARRLQGREDLLLVTEQMVVEWWSLWNLFDYEWENARSVLQLLRDETGITD